jgi:DNA polymerase II small subunit
MQKTLDEIAKFEIKPLVLTIEILTKTLQQKSIVHESLFSSSLEDTNSKMLLLEAPKPPNPPTSKVKIKKAPSSSVLPDSLEYASAEDIKDDITILKDPTGLMLGEGKLEDIKAYFHSRFNKLRKLLLKRADCKAANSIAQAKALKSSEEPIKVIGMVLEKKELSGKAGSDLHDDTVNSISVEIDDLESTMSVIFSGKNEELIKKAKRITLDEVLCIEGFISDKKVLIASDLYWPDIPYSTEIKHDIPSISAVFLSDIHFGSKYFAATQFEAFLEFLQGKNGNEEHQAIAKSIKYIIIAGDLIDGIGVYPNQEKNLAIPTIIEQYEFAAQYLKRIPNHIKIIVIPGGPHDAVRKAYPQPALNKKYANALYELKNVILLGNPAQFKLHGVNILVYHGDSMDDLIQALPGSSYQQPTDLMKELIISRHLSPIYGASTWTAPEKEDWMVIEDIPEILHCGHVHVLECKKYRGVLLLNSGTFQEETDFQRSLGIKPTPGIFTVVNLRTLEPKLFNFKNEA